MSSTLAPWLTTSLPLLAATDGAQIGRNPLSTVLLLALLGLVPFILMMTTSFLKFAVVLSILRTAMGTQQVPPTPVIMGLSVVLSMYVMAPVGTQMYEAVQADVGREQNVEVLSPSGARSLLDSVSKAREPMRQFLARHAHMEDVQLFLRYARELQQPTELATESSRPELGQNPVGRVASGVREEPAQAGADSEPDRGTSRSASGRVENRRPGKEEKENPIPEPLRQPQTAAGEEDEGPTETDLLVLIPAFAVTELAEAFAIGFMLFLPFLVIDMVVANILLAMGMHMLSPVVVSLPFKLLLFVMIDGWRLITQGLMQAYLV